MKKYLSIIFAIAFSVSISNNANADTLPSATQIVDMFKQLGQKMCEKADAFAGKFTIRSFSGALCLVPAIGKVALILCKNTPDFAQSGCAANARTVAGQADLTQVTNLINKAQLPITAEQAAAAIEF